MAQCVENGPPGAMTVLTLRSAADRVPFQAALDRLLADTERVSLAAINGPTQLVISGELRAIRRLELLLATDVRLCRVGRLQRVGAAFHSPLMRPAAEAFRQQALSLVSPMRATARIAMVSSVTAAELVAPSSPASPPAPHQLVAYLAEQIVSPVRWHAALHTIISQWQSPRLLPLGPGSTLTGLLRRDPQMAKLLIGDVGRSGDQWTGDQRQH